MASKLMSMLSGLSLGGEKPKARVSPYEDAGVRGTAVYGGFVNVIERNPKVAGYEKYLTYADILANTSIVAAGVRYFIGLAAEPKWTIDPADDSDQAKEAAEFVESVKDGLDTAWHRIIRRAAMSRFYGFSIQEWVAEKRDDGLIGIKDIESRPQHTIYQWDMDPQTNHVNGIVQRSPQTGELFWLPRWKCIYIVDDALSDSPEGFGMLRQVAEPAEKLKEYLKIEGIGFDRDLRGTPIGRAPISELEQAVAAGQITKDQRDIAIQAMRRFVEMQAKDINTGLLLDSSPFKNISADGYSWATGLRWGMELLQGNSTGIADLGKAIERTNWEIARILGVEQLLMGQTSGSRSLSEDKSRNLYIQIDGLLQDMAESLNRDFIGALWTLNGFDDKLRPKLKAAKVSFLSVEEIAATIQSMAQAGAVLAPDDEIIDFVRELLGAPHAPQPDPALMGASNG